MVEPVRKRRRLRIPNGAPAAAAGVALVVIAAMLLRTPAYAMPGRIGSSDRVAIESIVTLEGSWRDGFDDQGLTGDLAFYGSAHQASFMAVAFEGSPPSAEAGLRQLAAAWLRATGTRVAVSSISQRVVSGVAFACAPVAAAAASFRSVCTWVDSQGFVGSVASLDGGQDVTLERALATRSALAG